MSHGRAVALMVLVTLLWSVAGITTRHLEAAHSFEVTFWRSAFNALTLALLLTLLRGGSMWGRLLRSPWPVWVSGLCWATMFTAFMFALTMTTVARVLLTMAASPLITALFARMVLGHRIAARTWIAIGVAGLGIGWMFGAAAFDGGPRDLAGVAIALLVPLASAVNWTLLQHIGRAHGGPDESIAEDLPQDMLPAVLIGAVVSALVMLPFSLPFAATPRDLTLLGMLGAVQLAIPCLLAVRLSRELPAPEIALLGLLEVVFGVAWVWLFAGEAPSTATLTGGALVLSALVGNELLALRRTTKA